MEARGYPLILCSSTAGAPLQAIKTAANSKPGDADVHRQLTAVLGTRAFDVLGNVSC